MPSGPEAVAPNWSGLTQPPPDPGPFWGVGQEQGIPLFQQVQQLLAVALQRQLGQHGHDRAQQGRCIPPLDQQLANHHPAPALGRFLLALLEHQLLELPLQLLQRGQGGCPEAQGLKAIASGSVLVAEGLEGIHPKSQNQGLLGRLQTGHGKQGGAARHQILPTGRAVQFQQCQKLLITG